MLVFSLLSVRKDTSWTGLTLLFPVPLAVLGNQVLQAFRHDRNPCCKAYPGSPSGHVHSLTSQTPPALAGVTGGGHLLSTELSQFGKESKIGNVKCLFHKNTAASGLYLSRRVALLSWIRNSSSKYICANNMAWYLLLLLF